MTYYAGKSTSARISTLKLSSDLLLSGDSRTVADKQMPWEADSIDSASAVSVSNGVLTLPAGGHYHITSYIGCYTAASRGCTYTEVSNYGNVYPSHRSYAAKAIYLGYWADPDGIAIGVPWRVGFRKEGVTWGSSPAWKNGDPSQNTYLRGGESLQAEAVVETHDAAKTLEFLWCFKVSWSRTPANNYPNRANQFKWEWHYSARFRAYSSRCLTVIREVPK